MVARKQSWLTLCIVLALTVRAHAIQFREVDQNDLELILQTDACEILLGEPLSFSLRIENRGNAARSLPVTWLNNVRVWSLRNEGEAIPVGRLGRSGDVVGGERILQKGQRWQAQGRMLLLPRQWSARRQGLAFPEPGIYRLQAVVRWTVGVGAANGKITDLKSAKLESNVLLLTVKPVPASESDAFRRVSASVLARGLQGLECGEDTATEAQELIAAHAGSEYADHARRVIGDYWRTKAQDLHGAVNQVAARKAFDAYSGISPRVGALRLRALVHVAQIAETAFTAKLRSPDLGPLITELEGYRALATRVGLGEEVDRILRAYRTGGEQ